MTTSMCLALLATGCASNKVIQQRGWIGGEFLVAKRPMTHLLQLQQQAKLRVKAKQVVLKQKDSDFV